MFMTKLKTAAALAAIFSCVLINSLVSAEESSSENIYSEPALVTRLVGVDSKKAYPVWRNMSGQVIYSIRNVGTDTAYSINFTSNITNIPSGFELTRIAYQIDDGEALTTSPNWVPLDLAAGSELLIRLYFRTNSQLVVGDTYLAKIQAQAKNREGQLIKKATDFEEDIDLDDEITQEVIVINHDPIPPDSGVILIGQGLNDSTNPEFTNSLTNNLMFSFTGGSGINKIRLSSDEVNWANWQDYVDGAIVNQEYTWDSHENGLLKIFLQAQDASGNISSTISDSIILDTNPPALEIILDKGVEFTSASKVNLELRASDDKSGIRNFRLKACDNLDCVNTEWNSWQNFIYSNLEIELPRLDRTGAKTVCSQVEDAAGNLSEVDCDSISLDYSGPAGTLLVTPAGNGKELHIKLAASDSKLDDGSDGSGVSHYRISENAQSWSEWLPITQQQSVYTLKHPTSKGFLLVEYQDLLGNSSPQYKAEFNFIARDISKNIVINNDDEFTNTETVTLKLNPSNNYNQMKIWNLGENSELNAYEPSQEFKHWQLKKENGLQRVYAQFKSADGTYSEPIFDEIIVAPKYAIEYKVAPVANDGYTIDKLPEKVLSSDSFAVSLGVTNKGSLLWLPQLEEGTSDPVNISYHWSYLDGSTYDYNGNRAKLNSSVGFQQSSDNLQLTVNTPVAPGEYLLQIDAVHEGNQWFSASGNSMPTYKIIVENNPEYPEPFVDEELHEQENSGGTSYYIVQAARPWDRNWRCAGYDCLTGIAQEFYNCRERGIPNDVPSNVTTANEHLLYSKCWWPIFSMNRHLWTGINIPSQFRTKPWNYIRVGWQLVIPNTPDTWDARLVNISHAGNIVIKQGEKVDVAAIYENIGSATWQKSRILIGTQEPSNRASVFSQGWLAPNRPSSFAESDNKLPYSQVSFIFSLTAGSTQTIGNYRECFALIVDDSLWLNRELACWNVTVIAAELPVGNIFCTTGSNVYDLPNGNIVDHLPYNSQVTLLEKINGWARIDLGGVRWIDTNCFNQTGTIPNNQETSSDYAYSPPTGQEGIVVATTGLKLRFGPSLQFGWEITVPYGTRVKVIKQTLDNADGLGGWYEVQLSDGRTGWVPKGYIDLAPGYEPPIFYPPRPSFTEAHTCRSGGSAPMHFAPMSMSRVMRYLPENSNLRIIDVVADWYFVSLLSGYSGYIHQSYVCSGFAVSDASRDGSSGFARPYQGTAPITSQFGARNGTFHNGTDYGLKCGTPVYASQSGTVSRSRAQRDSSGKYIGFGEYIQIDHAASWQTIYAHLSERAVSEGQTVARGQYIGKSGTTGHSTGCHLHFEMKHKGIARNPEEILNAPPVENGNPVPSVPGSPNNFNSPVGATPGNPFAGRNGNNAGRPKIIFDRWISWEGSSKDDKVKESTRPDSPLITLTETTSDGKWVDVYGIGMPVNHSMDIGVFNEFRYCSLCGSDWEYHYQDHRAQQVKVVLFKPDWTYLGEVWNSAPDGRWKVRLPIDQKLKVGDQIKAEIQVVTKASFSGLKWWADTYESYTFDLSNPKYFGYPYFASNTSNLITVAPRWIEDPVERAFEAREQQLGGAIRDGVIHDWCGIKVLDYHQIGGKGDSILMYNPYHHKAFLVTGGIWWSYYNNGGCNEFGIPQGDEGFVGNHNPGWYQNFEKGNIYWNQSHTKSQPGIVKGAIRDYYEGLGGGRQENYLGYPEGKEWGETSYCGTSGTIQNFQNGRVYSSRLGSVDIEEGPWLNYLQSADLTSVNGIGWPVGKPTFIGIFSSWIMEVERGALRTRVLEINFEKVGCIARLVDPEIISVPYSDGSGEAKVNLSLVKLSEQNALCVYSDIDINTVKDDINQFKADGYLPLVGINADYFSDDTRSTPDGYNMQKGMAIQGKHYRTRSSLQFDKNNTAKISIVPLPETYNAVGGGPQFIKNGLYQWEFKCFLNGAEVPCNERNFDSTRLNGEYFQENEFLQRNAMSAAGITGNGDLVIAMNDGYNKVAGTSGITPKEMAQVLLDAGVREAIRFDGGPEAYYYDYYVSFRNTSAMNYHADNPSQLYIFPKEQCP